MGIRGALLAAIVALLLASAAACGDGDDAEAVDLPTWASRVCEAGQRFADAIEASRDDRNPQSLPLEERKERAVRLGRAEIDAAKALGKDLRALEPPEEAREFHRAMIRNADELAAAVEEQIDAIAKATAAQQIGVANASVRFRLDGSDRELEAAANLMPDSVVAALANEQACGQVPVPGETPTPVRPTPSI